jgi:hypothetical protein
MLELKVSPKNEYAVYPDVGGNLELPEQERFAVIIAKKHKIIQQSGGVRANGEFDISAFCKKSFVRIDNAPMLNFGKTKRALEFDDIFTIPELEPVANAVFDKIDELSKGGTDLKN